MANCPIDDIMVLVLAEPIGLSIGYFGVTIYQPEDLNKKILR